MEGAETAVRLNDVTVRFGSLTVLHRVSTSFVGGEIVGVRGANGSGKTTLLRTVVGVCPPSDGQRTGARRCAYVPAVVQAPAVRAVGWPRVVPRRRRGDLKAALAELGFEGNPTQPCHNLSLGNFRKLLLAEALTADVALIAIDELSTGLDRRGLDGLAHLLADARARGAAIIVADQDSRPMPWADRVGRIAGGRIRTEESDPAAAEVEVTFRGPDHALPTLLKGAARLGFAPTDEPSP